MKRKVGIIAPGAAGDLLLTTCILPYKDKLWPDSDIVWFVGENYQDLLKHNPYIAEVRLAKFIGDYKAIRKDGDAFTYGTRVDMNKVRERKVDCLMDLDCCYFSTPWCVGGANWSFSYTNLVKHIFGLPMDTKPWHPVAEWTAEEQAGADAFVTALPPLPNVMLETVCHSGQSLWNDATTALVIQKCVECLGPCNFFCASHKANITSVTLPHCVRSTYSVLKEWTIRQLVPIYNRCVFFAGCASGISTVTNCYRASDKVARFLYCGSQTFSSNEVARSLNVEAYRECDVNARLDEALKAAKTQYQSSRQS